MSAHDGGSGGPCRCLGRMKGRLEAASWTCRYRMRTNESEARTRRTGRKLCSVRRKELRAGPHPCPKRLSGDEEEAAQSVRKEGKSSSCKGGQKKAQSAAWFMGNCWSCRHSRNGAAGCWHNSDAGEDLPTCSGHLRNAAAHPIATPPLMFTILFPLPQYFWTGTAPSDCVR